MFAVIAGLFASFVLLDLANILVLARNMGMGSGEIGWRVALVLAGAAFSVGVLARRRANRIERSRLRLLLGPEVTARPAAEAGPHGPCRLRLLAAFLPAPPVQSTAPQPADRRTQVCQRM
jgi:hypothetical protein